MQVYEAEKSYPEHLNVHVMFEIRNDPVKFRIARACCAVIFALSTLIVYWTAMDGGMPPLRR
jgi:hypothetical protein